MTTSPADSEALDTIHRLLGSRIRVTMTDGRVATGKFTSLDRLGNIMLTNVVEQRWLAYHDVSDDRNDNAPKSNNCLTAVNDGNTADVAVIKETTNCNDESKKYTQKNVQHTKDESGLCHWTTDRSLTQAVIIGRKVAKVEITRRQWEARRINE